MRQFICFLVSFFRFPKTLRTESKFRPSRDFDDISSLFHKSISKNIEKYILEPTSQTFQILKNEKMKIEKCNNKKKRNAKKMILFTKNILFSCFEKFICSLFIARVEVPYQGLALTKSLSLMQALTTRTGLPLTSSARPLCISLGTANLMEVLE